MPHPDFLNIKDEKPGWRIKKAGEGKLKMNQQRVNYSFKNESTEEDCLFNTPDGHPGLKGIIT